MSIPTLIRLPSDLVDMDRAAMFSLAVLRLGPLLPLKPLEGLANPIAVSDEGDWPWELLDDCRRLFGVKVQPVIFPMQEILIALNQTFDMAQASAEQMLDELHEDDFSRELEEVVDLLESEDDAPVIRLVNTLISQGLKDRASDIHIEPFEKEVTVRFRIDGLLHVIIRPPKSVQAALISRIKVMADLDIAEKRHPQDGRFRVKIAGKEVDVRVSILPTGQGERVVMRLLDRSASMLTLERLGMSDRQMALMSQAIVSPHGIVLVTGPTGSGKSTTLYASLMQVDRTNRNVMTIEDPIEYQLEGVAQMQVQNKIGVSFSTGLRSILRQDPDIVMIGEIRDLETAEIAIQASLTGHLVFATLHTNDALSAVVRLRDMGIEQYLLGSSLIMVQAQRLVRRLCKHCKQGRDLHEDDCHALEFELPKCNQTVGIYEAVGCDLCMNTGYSGRVAIYEIVPITGVLRNAIHDGASLHQLRQLAMEGGMVSLRQDGCRHILQGVTTVDEVLRVSREDALVIES